MLIACRLQMHEQGVLSTDEMITRFFRLCTEMCVDVSYRLLKNESHVHQSTVVRQRCYYTLDAFVKLTWLVCLSSYTVFGMLGSYLGGGCDDVS